MCTRLIFRLLLPIVGLFSMLAISSCKKEYPHYPYNEITRFHVALNNSETLKGIIENKEIVLYWPPFLEIPDSIAPEIGVSERASVMPASGEKVPFLNGTTFTVKAENGSVQVFTLRISINQPNPGLYIETAPVNGVYTASIGGAFNKISGLYIIPDTNRTKIYLVNTDGKETAVTSSVSRLTQIHLHFNIPNTVDTGMHVIKVVSGKHTVAIDAPLHISYMVPTFVWPYTTQMKAGESYLINTASGVYPEGPTKLKKIRLRALSTGLYYDLEITSVSTGNVTVKIPAEFPAGTYNGIEFTSDAFPNASLQAITSTSRRIVVVK